MQALDWSALVAATDAVPYGAALALAAPFVGLLFGRALAWLSTPTLYRYGKRVL